MKNYEVIYDAINKIVIAKWYGYQNLGSIRSGGMAILEAMKTYKCNVVVNDNTGVKGTWFFAFEWAENTWFPQLLNAGIKSFAWIMSHDKMSEKAAHTVINKLDPENLIVKIFKVGDIGAAIEWVNIKSLKAA